MATKTNKTQTIKNEEVKEAKLEEVKEVKLEEVKEVKKNEEPKVEPLKDTDELEVSSNIPMVFYTDPQTNERFEWINKDDVQYITVDTLSRMWRQYRGYFSGLMLRVKDERFYSKYKIGNDIAKFEALVDEETYTPENLEKLKESLAELKKKSNLDRNGNLAKFTVYNFASKMLSEEKLQNIDVLRELNKSLGLEIELK